MSKKIGLFSVVGGLFSSIMGIIAATCVSCVGSCCGSVCLIGPLVGILGIGVAGFLHKYNAVFVVIGILFFILGIFLTFQNKKKSRGCQNG
jgi:hypothetical protein